MAILCRLTGTERHAPLPDHLVVPVGEARDELMGVGQAGGLPDIRLGGALAAVSQILPDRPGEKHGLLGHDPDLTPQLLQAQAY